MQTPESNPKPDQKSVLQHRTAPTNDENSTAPPSETEPEHDTTDFGVFPNDTPDMKRFLGCGG